MSSNTVGTARQCVCIGEVLWDLLPHGRRLGGAPANVAAYVSQFGVHGEIVSAVGDDDDGREILKQLVMMGVEMGGVGIVATLPTGTAGVTVDAAGKPTFSIRTP